MHNSSIRRCGANPVITAAAVCPTNRQMRVVGIFNCGGAYLNGKIYLVCRIAEMFDPVSENTLVVPCMGRDGSLTSETFELSDSRYDFSDKRVIVERRTKKTVALTSLSTFRLAVSDDGIHFTVSPAPCFLPDPVSEAWGTEDPRVTGLEGRFYLTYSSVSRDGVGVSLCVTDDFSVFTRIGMILPPANKDAVLFPEKIGGNYYLLHRPTMDCGIGDSDIWIADSPDLVHWGNHRHLCGCHTGNVWEEQKIGAGAPPVLTDRGWLVLYHGVDMHDRYSIGALLLDRDNPSTILWRTEHPVMEPEMPYEKSGFFSQTVFPCTALKAGRDIVIYYGAADNSICRVDIPLEELLV